MTKDSCLVGNECQTHKFIGPNGPEITQNLNNGYEVAQTSRTFIKLP